MNVKFKVKHNKVTIMGSCASNTEHPLDHLIKNYGEDAVREYFVAQQTKTYLHSRQPLIRQHLSSKLTAIKKDTDSLIAKRQQIAKNDLAQVVSGLKVKDPQGVKKAEDKYRMPIEDILGWKEVQEKFKIINQTSQQNIHKEEVKMNKGIEDRLADMHIRIVEKKQSLPLFDSYRPKLKELTLEEAHKKYDKQIAASIDKIDREVSTSLNFENYSKKFVGCVPMEQLDSLTKNAKRKFIEGSGDALGQGGCITC